MVGLTGLALAGCTSRGNNQTLLMEALKAKNLLYIVIKSKIKKP